MQKVLILGGSTYDLKIYLDTLPDPHPQTMHKVLYREGPGSTGTGKALALTYLGVPNVLYTAFGADWYGQQIAAFLQQKKIDYRSITDPAGTQRHINLMDRQGGRISMFITQSSEELSHDSGLIQSLIQDCDLIVLNIIPYCKSLIDAVVASGKPVWTDLHDYDGESQYHHPFLQAAQFVQFSSDNLPDYLPVMQSMIIAGKQMVVCTHGAQGATMLTADGTHLEQQAASVTNLADGNGAGDSFFAGLLYGYLTGKSWETCLRFGAQCGALAVTDEELCYRELHPRLLS